MAGPRALVVSVLAHGAALGAIAYGLETTRDDEPPARADPAATIEVVEVAATTPVEVVVLDEPAPAVDPAPAASRASTPSAPPRVATTEPLRTGGDVGPSGEAAALGPTADPGAPRDPGTLGPLSMRGRRHDLSLSDEAAARSLGPERPRDPDVKPTGKIAPAGREGVIDDAVAKFRVHGDGTVDISDKADIDWAWRVPIPTPKRILTAAKELGDDLGAWRDDPYRDTRAGSWQDLPRHLQATPGGCMKFGDEMCDAVDPATATHRKPKVERSLSGDGVIIPILGGKTDITSYLHRKFVGDPYASRKLKLLDDTRAERVQRGQVFRAQELARSAEMMENNLAALWASTTDPAARRAALFELWDECAEGDGETGAAGARARAMVLGWIGAKLPPGREGAYTQDEVARLDARRSSRQHFEPYAATPPAAFARP